MLAWFTTKFSMIAYLNQACVVLTKEVGRQRELIEELLDSKETADDYNAELQHQVREAEGLARDWERRNGEHVAQVNELITRCLELEGRCAQLERICADLEETLDVHGIYA